VPPVEADPGRLSGHGGDQGAQEEVDKKAAKPCTSPFKKKFRYGKHKVVITATSPLGIVDPTPAIVKFKITRPRR
jgi:hypothetical protein